MPLRIMGVAEAAEHLGVSKQVFVNWRSRYAQNFPVPLANLKMGPIYDANGIERWAKFHDIRRKP